MGLTEGSRAFLDLVAGAPALDTQTVLQNRADLENAVALTGSATALHDVRDHVIDHRGAQVPVRVYRPSADPVAPAVVYLHGGGWVLGGGLTLFDTTCRDLAATSRATVVAVDYRLAPEHPFPAALDDALTVLGALLEDATDLGVDPQRVGVLGDSAGGNLAAVCAQRLRGRSPGLRHQGLVYPVTDARVGATASYQEFAHDHFLTLRDMQWFVDQYAQGHDLDDPDLSPLRATDLTGLAPATVITAENDPLRDEGEAYASALDRAGVPTELWRVPGTVHPFLVLSSLVPEALTVRNHLGDRFREALAPVDQAT